MNYGTYATLEDLKTAMSIGLTDTDDDATLLAKLEAASRVIDGPHGCNRFFYVVTDTKYFSPRNSERILLDFDLLSITTLKIDQDRDFTYESTLATSDYLLIPLNIFPKWEIRIKPLASYSFYAGESTIEIAGLWGYGNGQSATPYEASGCTLTVATPTGTAVTLSDGTLLEVGQNILSGTEQMYITAISGNTGTVKRGINGTTAAAQAAAAVSIYRYPEDVKNACILLANKLFRLKDAPFGILGSNDMGTQMAGRLMDTRITELLVPYAKGMAIV